MPTDLNTTSTVVRQGLVLDDQSLVILESQLSNSRIWRIPYDQVRSLTVSRRPPLGRMAAVSGLILLPGSLLFLISEEGFWILAGFIIAFALALLTFYLVCGKTTLEFAYGQRTRTMHVIARPKKIHKFLIRFTSSVEASQEYYRQTYAEIEAAKSNDVVDPVGGHQLHEPADVDESLDE